MAQNKFSLSLEITTQPENFHSIKVGVVIHEVEVEYENNEELEEKIMEKQNIIQNILVEAKNLALTNRVYSSKIDYHTKDNENVSVKITDLNQDSKRDSLIDILGEESDTDVGLGSLNDFNLGEGVLIEGEAVLSDIDMDDEADIGADRSKEDDGLDI